MARNTTDRPAGDENAAAEVPVPVDQNPLVHDPDAVESGGAKMIRCQFGDVFVIGDTTVDGEWREFNASAAKKIIEAAATNGVRLNVAEKKG